MITTYHTQPMVCLAAACNDKATVAVWRRVRQRTWWQRRYHVSTIFVGPLCPQHAQQWLMLSDEPPSAATWRGVV